jgi:DNA-binding XRE family transcriptional regulator
MNRKKFSVLRDQVRVDPARRERVEQMKQAILDGEALAGLRETKMGTQQVAAKHAAMSQARIAQIERGENLYLSTLQRYIAALGGEIEIAAVFPGNERVVLTATQEHASA